MKIKPIATTQPIHSKEEISRIKVKEIIGPDTALFLYQKARADKNWKEADRIRKIALDEFGYTLAFRGTHYEAQADYKKQREIKYGPL